MNTTQVKEAVTISFYNVAVQWVVLNPILSHKQQSVATNNKVFDSLVNDNTIARSSNRVHYHTLKFGKAQVKFRSNFSWEIRSQLFISYL